MKTNSRTTPIAVEEITHAFESDVASADTLRASALSSLQRLRAAKAGHVEREQVRLASELGEDHPQVVQLKAEVAGDRRFVRELDAEIDRAKAQPPVVDKQGWTLHGYVRNQDLEGQPGLTVALFDRTDRWVEILGHACTDRRGYFQLRYQPATDPTPGVGRKAMAAVTREVALFIQVSNQRQEVLHRGKTPVTVQPGQVEYREIILSGESVTCPPPPAAPSEGSPAPSQGQTKSPATTVKPRKNRPPR